MYNKQFLIQNRDSLLSIFSEIYTARLIEMSIDNDFLENQLTSEACLQTILIFFSKNPEVEFPLPDISSCSEEYIILSHDLHSLVICEDCVRNGLFVRDGIKYAPKATSRYRNKYANI